MWAFGALLMAFLCLGSLRGYLRTRMLSYLLIGIGTGLMAVSIVLGEALPHDILFFAGFVIGEAGIVWLYTGESGKWWELADRATILERLLGDIELDAQALAVVRQSPPTMSRKAALLSGVAALLLGLGSALLARAYAWDSTGLLLGIYLGVPFTLYGIASLATAFFLIREPWSSL